jgi:hypothetical protein
MKHTISSDIHPSNMKFKQFWFDNFPPEAAPQDSSAVSEHFCWLRRPSMWSLVDIFTHE